MRRVLAACLLAIPAVAGAQTSTAPQTRTWDEATLCHWIGRADAPAYQAAAREEALRRTNQRAEEFVQSCALRGIDEASLCRAIGGQADPTLRPIAALREMGRRGLSPASCQRLPFGTEFFNALLNTSRMSLGWREKVDVAVRDGLKDWLQGQTGGIEEVPPPVFPAALSLRQEAWETHAEFDDRVTKARAERQRTIERLQNDYRLKVEERNRRVAEYNRTRQQREAGLKDARREMTMAAVRILAPAVGVTQASLDQQSGALAVGVQVEGMGPQTFVFTGTPQAYRRAALTDPKSLRSQAEWAVGDAGEVYIRSLLIEAEGHSTRGVPASPVVALPVQAASVTLPQVSAAALAPQSAVTVDRNQVEQILYREENETLRRRLEEQRRQQEQAVASAEARAAAEIARLRAETETLRNQPAPARPSAALATVREAHALVIGNSAYPGSGRLANPVNDARAMAGRLRALGFRVTEVSNASREQLVRGLSEFSRTAAQADLTLLFYAGHGVQISGVNYMIPVDMSLSDPAQAPLQGVSLNAVVEQYLPGRTRLVFLDACRDNPLLASAGRGFTKGLAPINVSEGTLIAYATKDGQVAEDGVGQANSPFTAALLEHLGDPDDIAVVLRTVRAKVMQRTGNRQQPWEYGSLTGGALVLSAIGPRR